MQPLIPYVSLPELPLTPSIDLPSIGRVDAITIKPFGALVAAACYVGFTLSVRHARRLGLDGETMASCFVWVVTGGFIGGHVLDLALYHPDLVLRAPSTRDALVEIASIWRSQSSFGGFVGAVFGLFAWRRSFSVPVALPWVDVGAAALPIGWAIARAGCAVAHDHPGGRSEAWFAVRYPHGGRFDLGLYEMLAMLPLAVAFAWLARRPRPSGLYLGAVCVYYAPVRFALDCMRARDGDDPDPRHLGLTPAQWLCFVVAAVGVALLAHAARIGERGEGAAVLDAAQGGPGGSGVVASSEGGGRGRG